MTSLNRDGDQWKEVDDTRLVKIYRILEAHVKRLEEVRWGSMAFTAELSETRHQLNKMFDSEMAIVTAKHHSELEKVRQETIKECIKELRLDWKPTEGFGCEEEKGFQKGIIAEQLQVKSKLQNLLSIKH